MSGTTTKAVGSSHRRGDARLFVGGRGTYIDDVAVPGVMHVAFLRSPHAHASIVAIRTAEADALPGVVRVVTAADLAPVCKGWQTSQTYPGLVMRTQYPLAEDRVVFVGQAVVAVVAESRALAEDAVELVEIEWALLPPACDLTAALAPDAARAHPDLAGNLAYQADVGDAEEAALFANSACVVEASFRFNRQTVMPMETRGVVANYLPGDGSLTVYQSHTAPHQLRSLYATHLGLDEGRIRVICPHVGGSFGAKIHLYSDEVATVAISCLIGRPVKFIADRLEALMTDIHCREQIVTARLALDGEGKFVAWRAQTRLAMGAFSTHPGSSVQEGDEAVRLAMAPYRVPHVGGRLEVVFQNKNIVGQYRGVGHPIAAAIGEHLIEKAAAATGRDPVALRLANYVPDDAYPVKTRTGIDLDALSHQACLRRLTEIVDIPALRAENERLRVKGIHRGFGIACFIERTATNAPSNAHIRKATAQDGITLSIDPSGAVRCAISVTDQGQGTHTVMAQVIADELGVAVDRIRIVSGDSQATPYGSGVRASRGTAVGGELALQASRELRAVVLEVAAQLLQTSATQLTISHGMIGAADGEGSGISLADLAEIVHFKPQLLPRGAQVSLSLSRHLGHDWPALVPTNGVQASLVEVDVWTGAVRLLRHWAVDDFGTIVNPLLVGEQVRGGISQGIGQALFEELVYDAAGQVQNASLADYLVPLASDLPDMVIDHVETPWPHSVLGAKGAGEAGTTGAVGAVLNAVNDAIRPLGAAITELPMTPERLLAALKRL
ncbi:xanthine dehydrogenase family protein molybdopterin-binding subunit [Reyranella sp.]|uniref:xanthine dehydrogenase family protein molybdopterin-binding subunit n=1 Tax=Reyranella sp. TaxID=1929291 RepID=UPI003D09B920